MNFKLQNKYYLKVPKIFLDNFWIELDNLEKSVKEYIYNLYLKNKQRTFKASLWNNENIIFHKIQVSENNKNWKNAKRVLIIILINNPDWINTIFPIFSFSTQEEKKYTTQYLKTKDFVKKVLNNFSKYQESTDINWEKINKILGIKL